MNCGEAGCSKKSLFVCSVHNIKFCAEHCAEHCMNCLNRPVKLDPSKEFRASQIMSLNKKVVQIKNKIVELANKLVLSINNSLKKSLYSLDQQRSELMSLIQIGKPEDQINELLGIVPNEIPGGQNTIKCLNDLENMLSLDEFKAKIQKVESKFKAAEVHQPKSTVSPVLESLEKLDLKGKIGWIKEQNFKMINLDSCIREIKIAKDSTFAFICMKYIVCKI